METKHESGGGTVTGSCFCGAVAFEVDMPTTFCGHCHCSMCRRNHGAGYVTWFGVPTTQFRLTSGKDKLHRFQSSDHGFRSFCTECGSSMFCELTEREGHIDIVLANVDGDIDRAPEMHIFFDERIDWIRIDDELPKLGGKSGFEPIED
jgi:hypothetical protein